MPFGIRRGDDRELGQNPKLLWWIAAATIPVGVTGLLFKHHAEEVWRFNRFLIGSMLVGVGLLMILAERIGKRQKGIGRITFMDSMVIGLAQALAIVPGTSRSGITITAGLLRGIERPASARFSFLLSTPAIAAAAAKTLYDLIQHGGVAPEMRLPFVLGILLSAITGCVVIAFLLRFLRTHTLKLFVYYRVICGIMVIALAVFFRYPAG